MQVSVEVTEGLGRKMTISFPEERVTGEVQKRLQQMGRTASIKGFRPGKVPAKVLAQRYGKDLRQEVIGELLQSTFFEAVTQENVQPAGAPTIESLTNEEGKDIEYTASFEVMPEVELNDISAIALEKPVGAVEDADLEKMMDKLRSQKSNWNAVKRAAADGDRVTIDFKGSIDGEEFPGGAGEDMPVVLGSSSMIEGFEAGLVGAKSGDELTLDLSFPEEYGNKELAGKPVQFAITIKSVEEPELPELNDEFAADFGIEEGGIEALRAEVRANMERELDSRLRNDVKTVVMDKLLEANPVEVPQAMIDHEAETMAQQMRSQMHIPAGKSGVDINADMFSEQAKRRVSLGLVIGELIKANELKVDADRLRAEVERLAAGYEQPQQVIDWYYGDKSRLQEVESLALEELAVEFVLSKANVTEKKVGFEETTNG